MMAKKRNRQRKQTERQYSQSQVTEMIDQLTANSTNQGLRGRMRQIVSGGYDFADTLHNIYLDFGYPCDLDFFNYWNMYRRFGIAKNVVELAPNAGWSSSPTVTGSAQFNRDFEALVKLVHFWIRIKGLDIRQRVGRYGGLFMRVKDGKQPNQPIDGQLAGINSLVEIMPLYESQLQVIETDQNPASENFGQPLMYQFTGGVTGTRNEKATSTFNIHPSRVVIAAEGSDNGSIYGVSSLEAVYNSLMDLRKIAGAGGEGFYKNAAQSVVFDLKDGASASVNKDILDKFNEHYDEFAANRSRRAMWTPGMDAKTLDSTLMNPKEFFMNSLNDVAAGTTPSTPATILIGQQTGRLASNEDSRQFLSGVQSRRENFMTEMTRGVIDWLILFGILPASEYELDWDDLLARSDEEKLDNADKMASINEKQLKSGGGIPFDVDEIREAAGFEVEEFDEPDETLPDDEDLDDE